MKLPNIITDLFNSFTDAFEPPIDTPPMHDTDNDDTHYGSEE